MSESSKPFTRASQLLVVVGAGPKAAALAAKARVLSELGLGELRIDILEREDQIAANWKGTTGYTTGKGHLCTPPEKDVGYPYNSIYGSKVDKKMFEYSWHAHKILFSQTQYSDWVDMGREQPTHEEWARYVEDTLETAMQPKKDLITLTTETTVERVEPDNGKVKITAIRKGQHKLIEADGIVFTGPSEPLMFEDIPTNAGKLIFDGRNYWENIPQFRDMEAGRIALIGGGESAAAVVLSLLDLTQSHKGPSLDIDIINRHGAIFTRGESYNENRWFSNPDHWPEMDEDYREEIIKRTDRGVFSGAAQRRLDRARNVQTKSGRVYKLERKASQIVVHLERGDPPRARQEVYDRVIVALGFNQWGPLQMLPDRFRPRFESSDELKLHLRNLERGIDKYLRIHFDAFLPDLKGVDFNVHMPLLAGLAQGPGFPSLCCLGHLSDRILWKYIEPPQLSR